MGFSGCEVQWAVTYSMNSMKMADVGSLLASRLRRQSRVEEVHHCYKLLGGEE